MRGLATYADSRVRLAAAVRRALDDLPPATGIRVGDPGPIALLGPCVVVGGDEPLVALAELHARNVGGAILAAHDGADRAELAFEARAYGAVPMLRAPIHPLPTEPTILVVPDEAAAAALDVPRLR
jgi:hypothetical protein